MLKVMEKGKKVFVPSYLVGETAKEFVERVKDDRYEFKCDVYVKDKYRKGIFCQLSQARKVIPGKKLGDNVYFWPRLRRALHEAGVKPIRIPGGDTPIHYEDEIVVPDFREETKKGSYFFVVSREEIEGYIEALPLDPAGKAKKELLEFARKLR